MTNKQVMGMVEMVGEFYRAMGDGEYIGTGKYKNIERKTMRENIFHEELIEFIEASAYKREKNKKKRAIRCNLRHVLCCCWEFIGKQ